MSFEDEYDAMNLDCYTDFSDEFESNLYQRIGELENALKKLYNLSKRAINEDGMAQMNALKSVMATCVELGCV